MPFSEEIVKKELEKLAKEKRISEPEVVEAFINMYRCSGVRESLIPGNIFIDLKERFGKEWDRFKMVYDTIVLVQRKEERPHQQIRIGKFLEQHKETVELMEPV